jgi:hypothetical protein
MSDRDSYGRVSTKAEVPLDRSPSIRYDPYNDTQTTKYPDLDVTVVEPIKRSHDRGPNSRRKAETTKVLPMTADNVRRVLGDDAPQDPESSSSEEDEEPQYAPPTQYRESRQAPRSGHPSGADPRWTTQATGTINRGDRYQSPQISYQTSTAAYRPDSTLSRGDTGPTYSRVVRRIHPMSPQAPTHYDEAQSSRYRGPDRSSRRYWYVLTGCMWVHLGLLTTQSVCLFGFRIFVLRVT